jgi:hypothetical protein
MIDKRRGRGGGGGGGGIFFTTYLAANEQIRCHGPHVESERARAREKEIERDARAVPHYCGVKEECVHGGVTVQSQSRPPRRERVPRSVDS